MSKQKKDAKKETPSEPRAEDAPLEETTSREAASMSDMEQALLQSKTEEPLFDPETLAALSNLAEMEASFLMKPAAEEQTAVSPADPNKPAWLSDDSELDDAALDEETAVVAEVELDQLLDEAAAALLDSSSEVDLGELPELLQTDEDDEAFAALFAEETVVETVAEAVAEAVAETVDHDEAGEPAQADEPHADGDVEEPAEPMASDETAVPADADEMLGEADEPVAEPDLAKPDVEALATLAALADEATAEAVNDTAFIEPEDEPLAALATLADTPETAVSPPATDEDDALAALAALDDTPATDDDTNYLEELIAAIDNEVEAVYGAGAMADLAIQRESEPAHNLKQYVVFALNGDTYAAPAAHVREVSQLTAVTRIPNVPTWLMGVTNLRGDVLSLIELRTFLGLSSNGHYSYGQSVNFARHDNQVMVVHSEKHASSITTGLVVDEIQDIRYLDTDSISDLSAPINDQIAPYLQGVYEENGRLLILLNLEKLLLAPEMWQFDIV